MNSQSSTKIYIAPWILPMNDIGICSGGIVVSDGRIREVGDAETLRKKYDGAESIQLTGAVLPGLVNCHAHLELSCFSSIDRPEDSQDMTVWIENLLTCRFADGPDADEIQNASKKAASAMFEGGVVLVADIHNGDPLCIEKDEEFPEICSIKEVVAPTSVRTDELIERLGSEDVTTRISPHAPYSTSTKAFVELKHRAKKNSHLFSVHVAESLDEIQFLAEKDGPFRTFLEKRNSWDREMADRPKHRGTVSFLYENDLLDENSLCVHCVHLDKEDIQILRKTNAKICICPGSNDFLKVGKAPLELLLSHSILPGIGTDSAASNYKLDMWSEIRRIRQNYKSISSYTILQMATVGGALSLNRGNDYGTLEKGKKAQFIEIDLGNRYFLDVIELYDYIVTCVHPENVKILSN